MSKALNFITILAILHYYQYYMRIMDIYQPKLKYKTKSSIETIYFNYK